MLAHYRSSRESVREALRLLETQGLVTMRRGPGGGPAIGFVNPADLGRTTTLYFQTAGATYRELFEAWELSETLLAERAARNTDPELRASVMEPYLSHQLDLTAETDLYATLHTSFHAAAASLANNRVLEITYQTFECVMTTHAVLALDALWEFSEQIEDEHIEIARAIVKGQPRKTRELMQDHTRRVVDIFGKRLSVDQVIDWH
jgi:DNA-binding FadR family transcriptional regulator